MEVTNDRFLRVATTFEATMPLQVLDRINSTTATDLMRYMFSMQTVQEQSHSLMGLNRMHRFIIAMREFERVISPCKDATSIMSLIWGSTRRLLQVR
jgi:hypothetical protein